MNLKEFTEFVDDLAQELNQRQLQCLLHSIARKVPEGKRKEFIVLLESIQSITGAEDDGKRQKIEVRKVDETEIRKEMSRLKKIFCQIEKEELSIQANGYEDYSMGYGCDNWVWEYEQTGEVCRVYEDGCQLLIRCVNDGFYKAAVELFDSMMEAEVMVENDWDVFTMGLEELQTEDLISVNLENLAIYVLYAVYQATDPEKRAQELYDYFSISYFKKVSMEKMLSLGREELEELPKFWESWISLLIEKSGDTAQRLLEEAVIYQKGADGMLAVARLASEKHPSLYLKVLQSFEQSHDSAKQLEIGKEALEKVEKKYVLRSEIALKTAEAAIWLGDEAEAEGYWLEAFLSRTTPVDYLRLMVQSKNWDSYQKISKNIILSAKSYGDSEYSSVKELTENFVSDYDRNILRFLSGDFEFVMEQCRKVEEPLGWSSTFMKCGIPLLLLLLLKDDDIKQGCTKMAEILRGYMKFNAENYFKGTGYAREYGKNQAVRPKEAEIFWQCFTRWKSEVHVMEEQAERYLLDLEKIIDKRVRAIISGKFRAHYNSVAELAAALGEVKESRGEELAKATILRKYKDAYPRHSSFHAALRENGIQDTR